MMKNKILLTILILVVSTALGVLLINIYILPTRVKAYVINRLERILDRKLEIEKLRYIPPTNLLLKNVVLYRDMAGAQPLIQAELIKLDLSLLPLLTKKYLISRMDLRNLTTRNFKLNGSVRTSLLLDPDAGAGFTGTLKIVDLSLKAAQLPDAIEHFNSVINLKKDSVEIDNTAYFLFRNTSYNLKGKFVDFSEPKIDFFLGSDLFNTVGDFIFKGNYAEIKKLDTRVANSTFDLMGDISNLSNPLFNLYGEVHIDMIDVWQLQGGKIEDTKLEGVCDAVLFFKGRPGQLENAELGLKIKSDRLSAYSIIFDNLYMNLRMKDGFLTTPQFSSGFYGGTIKGSINAEPFSGSRIYSADFSIQDGSLAKWAKEAKYGKKLYGTLSSRLLLKGSAGNIDTISGSGWAAVTDGYLWEIPILGGLADILTVSNLKSVVFKEAAGKFSIGERKVRVTDLTFYSDDTNISVQGEIDFNGSVDLMVNTNISPDLIEGSSDAAKIANILIQQAGQLLGKVRIRGTLRDPEYKVGPTASGIKPVEKILKSGLGDILKDILE